MPNPKARITLRLNSVITAELTQFLRELSEQRKLKVPLTAKEFLYESLMEWWGYLKWSPPRGFRQ